MDTIAPWLAVGSAFLAFMTAAIGVWKSTRNATAINQLEVKVDGRLTQLINQSQEVARLLGREEMRKETDVTAATLAEKAIAATLDATREKPIAVDVVASIPIAIEKDKGETT